MTTEAIHNIVNAQVGAFGTAPQRKYYYLAQATACPPGINRKWFERMANLACDRIKINTDSDLDSLDFDVSKIPVSLEREVSQ